MLRVPWVHWMDQAAHFGCLLLSWIMAACCFPEVGPSSQGGLCRQAGWLAGWLAYPTGWSCLSPTVILQTQEECFLVGPNV